MSAVCVIDFPPGRRATIPRGPVAGALARRSCAAPPSREPVPGDARSALAVPAPHRRSLADQGLFQRPPAGRAGLAAATVGGQFLLEIARRAVRREEVAQRGAATRDGVAEDAFHCV